MMDAEVYKAATRGSSSVLDDATVSARGEDYFLSNSFEGNNILHLAAQHGCADFVIRALTRFPTQLVLKKNLYGDTPLHVAAVSSSSHEVLKALVFHLTNTAATNAAVAATATATNAAAVTVVPFFMVENKQGDTPFHVAIRNLNLQAVQLFLDTLIPNHPDILHSTNKFNETPLHLIVRFCTKINKICMEKEGNFCLMSMIRELLLPYANAASSHDNEGLTPLLRAARNGDVQVCRLLIEYSPQSAEICDINGRNVLHLITCPSQDFKELKLLLTLPEVSILRDRYDCQGNTPAHCSVLDRDLSKLRVLSESLADLAVRNEKGLSVRDLISQEPDQRMKRALERACIGRIMDDGLYKAAQEGDTSVLPLQGYVGLCRTHDGSNIIHVAIQHGQITFIDEALKSFPTLIFLKDLNGDTPLHIAARLRTPAALPFLNLSCGDFWENTLKDRKLPFHCPPWSVKNSKGNTLLHEAARTSNYNVMSSLLNYMDINDVSNANDNDETSLHLFAKYGTYAVTDTLEDMKKLVESSSDAAYMTDSDGLTPVSRAAQCGRLRLVIMLLICYPRSAKIPDCHGKIFLHHLKASVTELVDDSISILHLWEEIFSFDRVDELRYVQDHDGNTPLHTAIINGNVAAVKFLLNRCLKSDGMDELSIINEHGNSVFQLLESEAYIMKEMKELSTMTKRYIKERAFERQKMEDDVYEMVIKGEADILDPQGAVSTVITCWNNGPPSRDISLNDFLHVTPDGSNTLHIALKYSNPKPAVGFVIKALNRFPSLILQPDCNGDTPLHIAAKGHNPASVALVKHIKIAFEKALDEGGLGIYVAPWKHKNGRGNMAIHEAIQGTNIDVSNLLLDIDPDMISYVNDLGETPLHIFAKYDQSCIDEIPPKNFHLLKRLTTENNSAAHTRDCEGLTPILRAAKSGRLRAVITILELTPQAACHRDPNGKSLLHLLHFTEGDVAVFSFDDIYELMKDNLFNRSDVLAQLSLQDDDGNTPLHSAIKSSNSVMVDALVDIISKARLEDRHPFINIANKEGHAVLDLLASNDDHDTITRLRGQYRTSDWPTDSYRVPEAAIKDTIQSLSVVAGLMAAITFAAALQVPGGFDSKNGSPVALKKAAFKAFLVSDTIAMCVSMMVLFCLLWAISSAKTKDRRLFLDFSMDLLLIAFCATLVAFMTGVYATTSENTLWLSILVCVFCSGAFLYRSRELIMALHRFKVKLNSEGMQPGIREPIVVKFAALVLEHIRRRPYVLIPTLAEMREFCRRILF